MVDIAEWKEAIIGLENWRDEKRHYDPTWIFGLRDIRDGRVLDVGCGETGLKSVFHGSVDYYGIDPLFDNPGKGIHRGVGEDLIVIGDRKFHYILMFSVLQHCINAATIVNEVYRYLVDGGLVFVTVPFGPKTGAGTHEFLNGDSVVSVFNRFKCLWWFHYLDIGYFIFKKESIL